MAMADTTHRGGPSAIAELLVLLQDSLHGFPRLVTVISEHICLLLLVFLLLHFSVVSAVL